MLEGYFILNAVTLMQKICRSMSVKYSKEILKLLMVDEMRVAENLLPNLKFNNAYNM